MRNTYNPIACEAYADRVQLRRWMPWVIEEEESLPLLKAAYDRGLTTWDTGMSRSRQNYIFADVVCSKRLLQWGLRRACR